MEQHSRGQGSLTLNGSPGQGSSGGGEGNTADESWNTSPLFFLNQPSPPLFDLNSARSAPTPTDFTPGTIPNVYSPAFSPSFFLQEDFPTTPNQPAPDNFVTDATSSLAAESALPKEYLPNVAPLTPSSEVSGLASQLEQGI